METLFSRPTSHSYPNGSRVTEISPKPDICKQYILALDLCFQGYNVEIPRIPGMKNPVDSLSRQHVSYALVRRGSVKDANEEYFIRLRVTDNAANDQIQ